MKSSTATPGRGGVPVQVVEALLDRVLVGAGERGVDQVAAVGVPFRHRQLVAVLDGPADLVDVGEVDLRVDALAEQVQAQRHQADVAGALAVAEQAALDAVGAGHVAQLGGRDRGAAVVVRVQRQHDRVAAFQVAVHPLDRVGVDVRGGHLDGRRQVDHHRVLLGRLPDRGDGVADLDRVLQFGAGVGLGRVLEAPVGVRVLLGPAGDLLGAVRRDPGDALAVQPEDDPALQGRGGVVQVDQRRRRALDGLEGARDQLRPGLGQHLDADVGRDEVLLDDLPDEVEVGLAGGREADLDLLVAHGHQQVEHPPLAGRGHRVDQRLVAVTQVDGAPLRRLGDDRVRPGAVRQVDRRERGVAVDRHGAAALPVVRAWPAGMSPAGVRTREGVGVPMFGVLAWWCPSRVRRRAGRGDDRQHNNPRRRSQSENQAPSRRRRSRPVVARTPGAAVRTTGWMLLPRLWVGTTVRRVVGGRARSAVACSQQAGTYRRVAGSGVSAQRWAARAGRSPRSSGQSVGGVPLQRSAADSGGAQRCGHWVTPGPDRWRPTTADWPRNQ